MGISIYGQENDLATWALARKFLHIQPSHCRPGNAIRLATGTRFSL
jgi:hypothetical protein